MQQHRHLPVRLRMVARDITTPLLAIRKRQAGVTTTPITVFLRNTSMTPDHHRTLILVPSQRIIMPSNAFLLLLHNTLNPPIKLLHGLLVPRLHHNPKHCRAMAQQASLLHHHPFHLFANRKVRRYPDAEDRN